MFAVAYGADATRKSNRQRRIRSSRGRIIAMLNLSQVLFFLILVNNLEYPTTITFWKYRQNYVKLILRRPVVWRNVWILPHVSYLSREILAVREFLAKNPLTELLDTP
jgi:hypothetical protein